MGSPKALATGLLGGGLTVASAFVPALGLSVEQQRIGFVVGVLLMLLGAALYARGRKTTPSQSSVSGDAATVGRDFYKAGGNINVAHAPPEIDPAQVISEARSELKANRDAMEEARQNDFYSYRFFLPETKRRAASAALSGTPAWESLDDAYRACEGLMRRLKGRGLGALDCDQIDVLSEDDLNGKLAQIKRALGHSQDQNLFS